MVSSLNEGNDDDLRALAAETIANCAKNSRNRKCVRQYGGIEKLVALLDTVSTAEDGSNEVARCAALALWSCSKNKRNRNAVLAAGALDSLAKLVTSSNIPLLIPVIGILVECAEEPEFRSQILAQNVVEHIVRALSMDNLDLKAYAAGLCERMGMHAVYIVYSI